MAFEGSDGRANLHQVGVLAFASKMNEEGTLEFRAIEGKTQRFGRFFLEQAVFYIPNAIEGGMAADHPRTLGGNLHPFGLEVVMFSPFDLDH